MSDFDYSPAPESRSVARLRESYGMYVDGKFVDGGGGTFKTVNPADESVLASVALADNADVDTAVKAARRAYDGV